jgi:hypothetical protein
MTRDDLLLEALISPARLCVLADPFRLRWDLSDCLQPLVGLRAKLMRW